MYSKANITTKKYNNLGTQATVFLNKKLPHPLSTKYRQRK